MFKRSMQWGLVVLFVCGITALAAGGPTMAEKARHADKNKDGVVDGKELHMEKNWEHEQAIKRSDKDHDMVPDKLENKAQVNQPWEYKADTNNDGVVDAREARDAKEHRRAWLQNKVLVNTPLEQKYDKNGDGVIEPAEARDMIRDRYELIKTQGKAKVDTAIEAAYDADKDGILDANEAAEMFSDSRE